MSATSNTADLTGTGATFTGGAGAASLRLCRLTMPTLAADVPRRIYDGSFAWCHLANRGRCRLKSGATCSQWSVPVPAERRAAGRRWLGRHRFGATDLDWRVVSTGSVVPPIVARGRASRHFTPASVTR